VNNGLQDKPENQVGTEDKYHDRSVTPEKILDLLKKELEES
jgi:hypothetical protein